MSRTPAQHETRPMYLRAEDLYRATAGTIQTSSRLLNDEMRRNALRVLQHVATATDATTLRLRAQAIHYARRSAVRLLAVIKAIELERACAPGLSDTAGDLAAAILHDLDMGTSLQSAETVEHSTGRRDMPDESPFVVYEYEPTPVGKTFDGDHPAPPESTQSGETGASPPGSEPTECSNEVRPDAPVEQGFPSITSGSTHPCTADCRTQGLR